MKNTERLPRWKKLEAVRSTSQGKSTLSKVSVRYTPKRSVSSSEKEFSLSHFNSTIKHASESFDMLSSPMTDRIMESKIESIPKKANHDYVSRDSIFDSMDLNMSALLKPVEKEKQKRTSTEALDKKAIRQNSIGTIPQGSISGDSSSLAQFKLNPKISIQENFKELLRMIAKLQEDHRTKRVEIEKILQEQHDHLKRAKLTIIEKFGERDDITDPTLRKIIDKVAEERYRREPKKLVRVTSEGTLARELPYNSDEKRKKSKKKAVDNPEQQKMRGDTVCKQNFLKIFGALEKMKKGLEDCKRIRHDKSSSKNRSRIKKQS